MKRLHVHVSVDDLAQSTRFYSTPFASEPTAVKGRLREMDVLAIRPQPASAATAAYKSTADIPPLPSIREIGAAAPE
jgi:hypothetical protein